MPDDPAASGNGGAATGSDPSAAAAPSPGSGAPEGLVPRTELDAVEARRRSLQSERDRLASELDVLKRGSGGNGNGNEPGGSVVNQPNSGGLTADEVARIVAGTLAQRDAMAEARGRISQEFALARPEVLAGSYQTPEEFVAAAARSHEAEKQYRATVAEEARQAVLADLEKAKPGVTAGLVSAAPPAPPASGEGGAATLTADRFAAMSFDERMAVPREQLEALARGA